MDTDSTQLIGAGTPAYPLDLATAEQPETCPHCQATIPPGEMFCVKCGFQRGTWAGSASAAPSVAPSGWRLAGSAGLVLELPLGESILGRGEVDLQVADNYLSRRHARLDVKADGVAITDLGSANGSFLGERRLGPDERVELAEGTELKLGQSMFVLQRSAVDATIVAPPVATTPAAVAEPPAELAGLEPPGLAPIGALAETHVELAPATSPWALARPGAEPEYFLPYGESIVGRKPDKATIVVRGDGYISGAHMRLLASETTLEATDLGSTNGSFIGGEQLAPGVVRQLGAGDSLRLGQTELTVVYNEIGEAKRDVEPLADVAVETTL